MVALEPDRGQKLTELKTRLQPMFPHLAENVFDFGPLNVFLLDPDRGGRDHLLWLTDGEVSGSIEMSDLRHIPKPSFALQLEIIPFQDQLNNRYFFAWNMICLRVIGAYDPASVVSEIEAFGALHDAYAMLHFLSRKVNNPPSFDFRFERPGSLEEYLGVLNNIKGRSLVISLHRHLGEFEEFMKGN